MPAIYSLVMLAPKSAADQLVRSMFDDTFAGIHHLAWFDWAMLIPYFTVLIILSVYGLHRYDVIRTYFKHLKNATGEPPLRFAQLPPVTIQLPMYNERYVVERLIEEVVRIEYPRELLQIQVLDDSTDDTHPFAEALVERYRNMGYPIEYHHRTNRHVFKAGDSCGDGTRSDTPCSGSARPALRQTGGCRRSNRPAPGSAAAPADIRS